MPNIFERAAAFLRGPSTPTPAAQAQPASVDPSALPPAWQTATYAPGWPIRPMEQPIEDNIPREIDYPVSANINLQPRVGYGLMPFNALSLAFENVTEVKMSVHTLTREFCGFTPRLMGVKNKAVVQDHPYSWIVDKPDRVTPFSVWITRFLQSTLIFDAGAAHVQPDGQGNLAALNYVDGSTLFVILDTAGRTPHGTATGADGLEHAIPAFTQIIKGTPFQWYSSDDIWYKPRFRRYNAPYGMPGIEDAWSWIMIIANITAFELAHYRTGNMPEGWMEGPENYTLAQVDFWEQALNARMSSGPTERNRIRVVPNGFKYTPTKPPDFPQTLYERALDNLTLSYGIPPSEFGKTPGAGLGGKGYLEVMQSSLYRMALQPLKAYVEDMFNNILTRFGVDDVIVDFAVGTESIDPEKQREGVLKELAAGLLTINEARAQLGYEKIPGGDVRIVISGQNVIVLDDYLRPGATPTVNEQLQAVPVEIPESAAVQALKILQNGITIKSYSLPAPAPVEKVLTHPRALGRFAPKAKIDAKAAKDLGDALGVNWERINIDQFLQGVNEEMEHGETLDWDAETIGRIALDHLKETPDYYDRLHQAVEPGAPAQAEVRADLGLVEKAVGVDHPSAMIALYPPEGVAKIINQMNIAWPEGTEVLPPEELHVALAYLGDIQELPSGIGHSAIMAAVQQFCDGFVKSFSLYGTINGIGRFVECHKPGMNVIYCNVDVPALASLRQALVGALEAAGIPIQRDHGFTPHMTLAYIPESAAIEEIDLDPISIAFEGVTVAYGSLLQLCEFGNSLTKLAIPDLSKVTGVDLEDDAFYQAPLLGNSAFDWPDDWHANEVQIVAIQADGESARPALWKPENGEMTALTEILGGPEYTREEAAYITDRTLSLYLVPVAYSAEVDGEPGAVLHYVPGADALKESKPASQYSELWIERAAVLDYLTNQLDRHSGNWLTHPDDPTRPVLIDNGMSFPTVRRVIYSPFVDLWSGKEISSALMLSLQMLSGLDSFWRDLADLVGADAMQLTRERLDTLINGRMIPTVEPGTKYATLATGTPAEETPGDTNSTETEQETE